MARKRERTMGRDRKEGVNRQAGTVRFCREAELLTVEKFTNLCYNLRKTEASLWKGMCGQVANFTRKAIKEAFLKLLEQHPLTEITVKGIVEECGINRNSFYYHYQDLPALVEEIIKEEAEGIIRAYPSVTSIVECFDAATEFASRQKKAIMHIYRSVNREVFERNLMMVCEYFVRRYVDTALDREPIQENDKKTIVDYYKCVCFGLIVDWLEQGMDEGYISSIRRIFLLKKDLALEIARLLQGQI